MLRRFTSLYPVWIVTSSVMALIWPETLRWFSGQWVVWALTIVMLSMGLTLALLVGGIVASLWATRGQGQAHGHMQPPAAAKRT